MNENDLLKGYHTTFKESQTDKLPVILPVTPLPLVPLPERQPAQKKILLWGGSLAGTLIVAVVCTLVTVRTPEIVNWLQNALVILPILGYALQLALVPTALTFQGKGGNYILGLGLGSIPFLFTALTLLALKFLPTKELYEYNQAAMGRFILLVGIVFYLLKTLSAVFQLSSSKGSFVGYGMLSMLISIPVVYYIAQFVLAS